MGIDHVKENMIRELVQLKKRIDDTIRIIDSADTIKELALALIDNPMFDSAMKGLKKEGE